MAKVSFHPAREEDEMAQGVNSVADYNDPIAALLMARKTLIKGSRNAMGEYIVPPGGKALTSLGDCNPAPSDYSPKVDLTKPSAPQYSVAGRHKPAKLAYHASPADNDTSQNLIWSDKVHTLKEKGTTRPYDIRPAAHINDSVGPAQYYVETKGFGEPNPKWKIGTRNNVDMGPPNKLVQPVDSHGFDVPGANHYRPDSGHWRKGQKKSFGSNRRQIVPQGPGPAEYDVVETPGGPAYSLAKRLQPPLSWKQSVNKDSPGPGTYDLGTTVGKAMAKSVSGRHPIKQKLFVPAPNLYSLPDTVLNQPTATMTYRPFEPNEGPHPGPTQYSVTGLNLRKAPAYSCAKHTKPSFPDILSYPLISQKHSIPGPGEYEHTTKDNISSNDQPKFSMGKRARASKNEVPGPNHYLLRNSQPPEARCAPAFSMGRRIEPIDKRVTPGPAAYYPKVTSVTSDGSSGYSMTKRPDKTFTMPTPAPNAYKLEDCQTRKGITGGPKATLKSRASPYVYSGFGNTSMIRG